MATGLHPRPAGARAAQQVYLSCFCFAVVELFVQRRLLACGDTTFGQKLRIALQAFPDRAHLAVGVGTWSYRMAG